MTLYRKPCGGGRERQWPLTRGCFQHKKPVDRVQKWSNDTVVASPGCDDDIDYPPGGGTYAPLVPPFTQPSTDDPNAAEAGQNNGPYTGGSGPLDCSDGHAKNKLQFGPWLPADFPYCPGRDASHTTVDLNCYSLVPGEYVDERVCWKMGFKNVQARHWWYGRFGFTDTDGANCAESATGCDADIPTMPDATKYLTIRVSSKFSRVNTSCGGSGSDFSYDLDVTFSIDRYSGVIRRTAYSYEIDDPIGVEGGDSTTISNALEFLQMFCAQAHTGTDFRAGGWNWSCGPSRAGDPSYPCDCTAPNDDPCGLPLDGDDGTHYDSFAENSAFDCSNTHIHLTYQSIGVDRDGDCSGGQTVTEEIEAWLSDPYTSTDFRHDVIALLEAWDMADDRTYPWRLDGFTSVAPLVEYNCVQDRIGPQCPSQNGTVDPAIDPLRAGWSDPNAALYDGSIIGRPLPHPGSIAILQDAGSATDTISAPLNIGISGKDPYQLAHPKVTVTSAVLFDGDGNVLHTGVEGTDYSYDSFSGVVTFYDPDPGGDNLGLLISTDDSPNTVQITYTYDVEMGGHFDYRHLTYRYDDPALDGVGQYLFGYGAWSATGLFLDPTDYHMPRCATRWTDNAEAQSLPHGAWQIYAGGRLWMQKWAEIKVPRPSQNCFGPCGPQRYEVAAANTSCIQNATGDPPLVTVADGEGSRFAAADQVIYWTGAGDGGAQAGLYTVTSVSGDAVQLSAKICDVPVAWPGGPLLGVLRFPSAWSICGRCEINTFTDNGDDTLTVTLVTPAPYLRAGDSLDFTTGDAYPETISYSGVSVLAIQSPTQFTVNRSAFSGLGSGALPAADHVKSHGAPGWWWYDVKPKGDFVFAKWGFNNRDIAIDNTLRANQATHGMPQAVSSFSAITDCVPFDVCNPQVMAISPNYNEDADNTVDDFPNGVVYDFDTIIPDERFGAQWQAVVQQVMDDIFWATPPKPCSTGDAEDFGDTSGCSWLEDDGSCTPPEDTCLGSGDGGAMYFPHRPVVEARAALPITWLPGDTVPALPDGVYIGYLTLDELDTTDEVHGQVLLLPPGRGGRAE